MQKNTKVKTIALTAAVSLGVFVPLSTTISCASAAKVGIKNDQLLGQLGDYFNNGNRTNKIESLKLNSIAGSAYSNFSMSKELDPYSGYSKEFEVKSPLSGALLQDYMTRSKTGYPMYPTIDYNATWNWNPNGVDIRSSEAEAKAAANEFDKPGSPFNRMGLYNAYSSWCGNNGVYRPTPIGKFGGENNLFWQPKDWRFSRATVRDIADSTYGAKIKPTQSTYGSFSFFTNTIADASAKLGLLSKSEKYTMNDFWQYNKYWGVGGTGMETIQIPDGQAIDAAHRNGTLSLGNVNWTNFLRKWERSIIYVKDSSGHYPFARGLANIADFYGFDGWIFDTENSGLEYGSDSEINDLWRDYMYYARDLNKYPTVWSGITAEQYKKFNYTHKPQTFINYEGSGGNTFNDFHYTFQHHGSGVHNFKNDYKNDSGTTNKPDFYDSSELTKNGALDYSTIPTIDEKNNGIFKYSEGYNPGEGGRGLAVSTTSAKLAVEKTSLLNDYPGHPENIPEDKKPYMFENRSSIWYWLYQEEDFDTINKSYSSTAGDPRFSPLNKDTFEVLPGKASLSDAIQEKSSVVGRSPWSTTFGRGFADKFNLWGGKDISKFVQHGEEGWRTYVGQTALPTYRWIVDEYDSVGNLMTDTQTLDSLGKVRRSVEPTITNDDDANWMWGSHLTYNGKIAKKGESFENLLYASNIPVRSGDKFTIKVKNGDLTPDLAVWTAEGEVPVYSPLPNRGAEAPTETPWGDPLLNKGLFKHVNESTWNVSRTKSIITPIKKADLGNSGWTEITYDLSKLNGKTIMDFGVKVTAEHNEQVLTDHLRIGEMKFKPKGYSPSSTESKINISNVKTEFVWDKTTSINARISWDADKRARTFLTFLSDDQGNLKNLMWVGANPAAFLENLPREEHPKIVILALNDAMDLVSANKVTLDMTDGGTNA